jgi:sortase (surface protein transpeptidase)
VALRIGAIDLAAPVVEVGVDPRTGELALPGVDRAGWYRFGPGPAATRGSIVIAGHVDSVAGPGVFFRLAELAPGDRITVTAAGGAARRFEVVGREVYRKGDLPLERYFARDGAPRLTLITCTGPFDRPAGGYRDNLVVTAVPTGQLPAGR